MENPSVRESHYVIFDVPGEFFSKTFSHEIDSWDVLAAVALSETIYERYGAKPYAFRFNTQIDAWPKTVRDSKDRYFIEGVLRTYDEIASEQNRGALLANMRSYGWPIVVECDRPSFHMTQPFREHDRIVNIRGEIVERGDDPRHVAYRESKLRAWKDR